MNRGLGLDPSIPNQVNCAKCRLLLPLGIGAQRNTEMCATAANCTRNVGQYKSSFETLIAFP